MHTLHILHASSAGLFRIIKMTELSTDAGESNHKVTHAPSSSRTILFESVSDGVAEGKKLMVKSVANCPGLIYFV